MAEEQPEDERAGFLRKCMHLLTKANGMAAFETDRAVQKSVEVLGYLNEARKQGWPGVETIHAMHSLLVANLAAYMYDGSPAGFEHMVWSYEEAIKAASRHADDPLYPLRAMRAYAGMLVYYGTAEQAGKYLRKILVVFDPPNVRDEDRQRVRELRERHEDLWVETLTQLAEVEWLLGNPQEAHDLLDRITYPVNINMDHVAAKILRAQLYWHTGQRRRGARLAKQAARDAQQVANQCHSCLIERALLLRRPWLGGMWRFKRASRKRRCPRI